MRRCRRGWLRLQGSAPILAGALLACAGTPGPPGHAGAPHWALRPPPGCASGHSGPTLDPGDAIRQARVDALESLAATWLGVRVVSELRLGPHGLREWTLQETRGTLAHSRIVALAAGRDRAVSGDRPLREVFALACPADLPAAVSARRGAPGWLLDVPSDARRICVPAVGGPTRRPARQHAAALRDGRRALAQALEIRILQRSFDDRRGPLRVASQSEASARAVVLAAAVDGLEASWLDEGGSGPLHLPGVLYGLVCSEV